VHYVVFNLTGSALFLIAVSLLYGLTGTLNMADLARQAAATAAREPRLAQAAALLLLVVFASRPRCCRCTSGCRRPMPRQRRRWPRCSPS
jgi:hypothetical protein